MKIGYPCINNSIGCTANSTFRLANYSEENLKEKVSNNINCLKKILEFNVQHRLFFFRISSEIIPFASHPICKFNWQKYFSKEFEEVGKYIKENEIRISMHPDQFVLINAKKEKIIENSIRELIYHCDVLDLMKLDLSAKVQIHVGGVYGDKEASIQRFIENYKRLPMKIKKRLVIENDDRNYSLKDCLRISDEIGIPVVFDSFHHLCFNNGEKRREGIEMASETWRDKDGVLMTDYSSQEKNAKKGTHARHIDIKDFKSYLDETRGLEFDIMLEIKDKEKSALEAVKYIK